ncbi:MAG: M91 family zinc metallopeptidase [Terriglobia bacterium]
MPLEKTPATPISPDRIPPGGRRYKVKDHDSWTTVAAACGVSPLQLVEFNFGTRDPREINWYLHYRVGCKAITSDHYNYMFSSAADPGVIYLPPAAPAPKVDPPRAVKLTDFGAVGIWIKGTEEYKSRVKATLNFIDQTDTGDALLEAIGRAGRKVVIKAWEDPGDQCLHGNPNADAQPDDEAAATMSGKWAYRTDRRFDPVPDLSLLRSLLGLPQEPLVGTGAGSNASVHISPQMWGYGNTCGRPPAQAGSSPVQVLFHELVHAYRMVRGHFHSFPTTGPQRMYDNEEEFFAVVLTNILISDPTYHGPNRTLRSDHQGFTPLSPALSTTAGFLSQKANQRIVQKLKREEPQLVKDLRGIRGAFNPFSAP